jgi:alkanesulfonate monooxygenase SsuD/methylene tetrahydromethanopterin reductase-like flavin-dependent oxidoreductase (luciferase family)
VGVGPGFSPYEFSALGVPLDERYDRLEEALVVLRGALTETIFTHEGAHWQVPPVTLKPRPYRGTSPTLLRACARPDSVRQAALEGTPLMLGLKATSEIAETIAAYRRTRGELGLSPAQIEKEVSAFRVLRRVSVAQTDAEAVADVNKALAWERQTARRVHESVGGPGVPAAADGPVSDPSTVLGGCLGTPGTVLTQLRELRALGVQHVIAWFHFGDMPFSKVERSMDLMAREVIPLLDPHSGPGVEFALEMNT